MRSTKIAALLVAASLLLAGRSVQGVEIDGGTPASDIEPWLNGGDEKLPESKSTASANANTVDAQDCDAMSQRLEAYKASVEAGQAQSAEQVGAIRSDLGEARIAIARLNVQIAGLAQRAAAGDKSAQRTVTKLRSKRARLAKSTYGCRSSILKRLASLERSVKSLKTNDTFFFKAWKKQGGIDSDQNAKIAKLRKDVDGLKNALQNGTPATSPAPAGTPPANTPPAAPPAQGSIPGMSGSTLPGQPIRVEQTPENGITFAQYVLPCSEEEVADAPLTPSGTVVRVYLDANCNGARDEGEAFAAGAIITVVLPSGQTGQVITGKTGGYVFPPTSPAGTYSFRTGEASTTVDLPAVSEILVPLYCNANAVAAIQNWFTDEENGLPKVSRDIATAQSAAGGAQKTAGDARTTANIALHRAGFGVAALWVIGLVLVAIIVLYVIYRIRGNDDEDDPDDTIPSGGPPPPPPAP